MLRWLSRDLDVADLAHVEEAAEAYLARSEAHVHGAQGRRRLAVHEHVHSARRPVVDQLDLIPTLLRKRFRAILRTDPHAVATIDVEHDVWHRRALGLC